MRIGTCLVTLVTVAGGLVAASPPASATAPPESTFFATAGVEEHGTANTASDGDLWPSCWSDDDNLYAANGDGKGFSGSTGYDTAVSRISGTPGNLTGATIAGGDAVGSVWNSAYNRKPTGMVCVDGTIYLAVQDLKKDTNAFDEADAASISKSTDHGHTWTWDHSAPMFGNFAFTTIMFLDYGKSGANNTDGYVYAYGLDNNWRDSYSGVVADPQDMYLGRVPKDSVQNRAAWQFYAGTSASAPTWSSDINARVPVLTDTSRRYSAMYTGTPPPGGYSVIGQGGVVYDKPLNRYIYTSWTEFTFEFYDSPTPYGPWQHFLTKDFGGYPWTTAKHGGYGVTIPSKFISADGTNMWLQSNVCPCASAGVTSVYNYSLRRMTVSPYAPTTPTNAPDDGRNLAQEPGTVPIEKSLHYGNVAYYNDGVLAQTDDDWNDENKSTSWWGYTWPRSYTVNKVAYTTGNMFSDGGWFGTAPTVQVRVNGVWTTVTGQQSTPAYPTNNTAGPNKTYVFSFDPTTADGVRIIGGAGGTRTFTSIAELQVYYGGAVTDPGFEKQPTSTVSAPWTVEGPDQHGIDRGGQQHSGTNNAWIRTSSKNWNAVTQVVPVKPNTSYRLTGWIRDTANVSGGYFGVRAGTTSSVLAETHYGSQPSYGQLTVPFTSGSNTTMTIYAGYWSPGADSWIQVDDVALTPT
ncbi:hypothetical protein GCM10009765_42060 [Fodinicola feengrottensis]|uniref:DUF4185 domain-containing protein n=1 Tax=Fodinicola feengrottensis TaxID=435914 RepID=A0ABP4THQ2_9ACTN